MQSKQPKAKGQDTKAKRGKPDGTYTAGHAALAAECVYLYYLVSVTPNHAHVEVYFEDQGAPIRNIESTIKEMVYKIINGSIRPVGWAVADLDWRRRGYIAAVLNSGTRRLEPDDAIEFIYDGKGGGNHTFRSGTDLRDFDDVSASHCLNYMVRKDGKPWKEDEFEGFKVKFNHRARAAGAEDRRSHNETGQNTGPPVGNP